MTHWNKLIFACNDDIKRIVKMHEEDGALIARATKAQIDELANSINIYAKARDNVKEIESEVKKSKEATPNVRM